jgi:hypothetical protein
VWKVGAAALRLHVERWDRIGQVRRGGRRRRRSTEPPVVRARAVRTATVARGAALEPRLSERLLPSAATQRALANYVARHRRRLPPTHRASDQARAHAASIGIVLAPQGETWVQPHARGLAPDAELVFDWRPRAAAPQAS